MDPLDDGDESDDSDDRGAVTHGQDDDGNREVDEDGDKVEQQQLKELSFLKETLGQSSSRYGPNGRLSSRR